MKRSGNFINPLFLYPRHFALTIVETAKANNLRLYDYLNYLLEELPNYVDGSKSEIPSNLLPWSEDLPLKLRKPIS